MKIQWRRSLLIVIGLLICGASPPNVDAQGLSESTGVGQYFTNCATCHESDANPGAPRTSVLKQPEMSVDSGPWRPVFPVDGIVDSLSEDFRFSSGALGPGEHVVTFRIYDQNENVGIGKATVRMP